jgi:hypothetical protein
MTRVTELAVRFVEALRDDDSLAAAQALADARAYGGRQAVGAVLASACEWGIRTAPRAQSDDGQAGAAS